MGDSLDTTPQLYSRIIKVLFSGLKKIVPQSIKKKIKRYQTKKIERYQKVEAQVRDVEVLLQQELSILQHEANIPPPPPKHLQVRVTGHYNPDFIESGFTVTYQTMNQILKPIGKELKDFQSILDFGCGCGRVIRALGTLLPACKLYGTDIDEEAIEWLKCNYLKFAEYSVAPHFPPTIFEDQMFDLIFGISVFTHLPEEMQFQWLKELGRITKPHGYVILTTHGEEYYKHLDVGILDIMNDKGFFYNDFGWNYGKSISLPDFYQTAYHSHAYIQREWGQYFNVIDINAVSHWGQDTVLLQNRHYKENEPHDDVQ
jgi:SAM-dependent methyltransferase